MRDNVTAVLLLGGVRVPKWWHLVNAATLERRCGGTCEGVFVAFLRRAEGREGMRVGDSVGVCVCSRAVDDVVECGESFTTSYFLLFRPGGGVRWRYYYTPGIMFSGCGDPRVDRSESKAAFSASCGEAEKMPWVRGKGGGGRVIPVSGWCVCFCTRWFIALVGRVSQLF